MKFYDKPYREYFKARAKLAKIYSLNPEKKWVLFPENYFFAFLSLSGLKHLAKQQNANFEYLEQAKIYGERSLAKLFRDKLLIKPKIQFSLLGLGLQRPKII